MAALRSATRWVTYSYTLPARVLSQPCPSTFWLFLNRWGEFIGNIGMKEIAHGVHENAARDTPSNRIAELFRDQPEIEPEFERMPLHSAESLRESLRVAVLASGTDLRAAPHRVPGSVRPLDL